jgi:hypothetical protein
MQPHAEHAIVISELDPGGFKRGLDRGESSSRRFSRRLGAHFQMLDHS